MRAWAVERPGPDRRSARSSPVERPVPEPGPGEVRVARAGLRRLPHRPPPRRGRPGAPAPGRRARPRGRRRRRRPRPGRHALPARRPHRHRLAPPHLRRVPVLPPRRREPVRRAALHRLGRRRRLRRVRRRRRGLRLPAPGRLRPTSEAAPLLCAGIIGYRALRRAALPPGGRLGIYGFGASAHLTAQVALHEGATVHVLTRSPEAPAARPRARRRLGRRRRRRAARAARRRHALRPRRRARAGRAARPRPRRHAGHRRHPPEPDPAARLRHRPVRGAPGPQRHRQHPPRRRGAAGPGGRASRSGRR